VFPLLKQQHKKLTVLTLPVRPVSANVAFQCMMTRADIWLTTHAAIVSNLPLYWHRDPQTRALYRLIHAGVVASLRLITCVGVRAIA